MLRALTASVGRPEAPKPKEEICGKWQALSPLCWWHLVPPEPSFLKPCANQCVFLMEMFCFNCVNNTVYLLWNLPFFKLVLPKTSLFFFSFLKSWADNGSRKQYPCQLFYDWGWPTLCHSISKCILWERGLVKLPQPWGVSFVWLEGC